MWQLIVKKFIPPTRHSRYCCAFLKENGGHGRLVATGVRKSESKKRSTRQLAEQCYGDNSKRFLNPIIEWDENDVWTYIKVRGLVYCNIYDEVDEHGRKLFKRLGCVMCPLSDHQKQEAERWPKIADQYRRTCDKAYARLIEAKGASTWKNGTDMVNWWISGKAAPKEFKDQVRMTDEGGVLFFER
jgi:phosphoadenosine phosphosulfate reductase